VANVSKSFTSSGGSVSALGPLSFGIQPGEFVCVVGPSGCGKTSLLNLIAGLDRPDSGEILVDGKSVRGPSPERLLIFQDGALFPWLSVRENVEFGLRMQGVAGAERRHRAERLLTDVGLSGFVEARIHQLSGGMRQRVALARGLALDPSLLLMDEPFAALDAQTRDLLGVELQQLWAANRKTILFITHNLREAACLGNRVLVMSRRPGRLIREIRVDLPRPRRIEDEGLIETIRPIIEDLRAEVAAARGTV
jgi:NitT/TauT family transport system ATP-binding protein